MAIELSHEEVSKIIDEISQGGKIVFVKDSSSSKIPVFIKHNANYPEKRQEFPAYYTSCDPAAKDGDYTTMVRGKYYPKTGIFKIDEFQC